MIPLLFAIQMAGTRLEAFRHGFLTGVLFYGLSLFWLNHVSGLGWIFVMCLEGFFLGVFAWFAFEGKKITHRFLRAFWIASAWTAMEILRSEIPVFGFGWNLLAYSQSHHPVVLMSADTVGAYGLGFVIACVNTVAFELIELDLQIRQKVAQGKKPVATGIALIPG